MILGFLFFIWTFLKHCKALSTEKYRHYTNTLLSLLLLLLSLLLLLLLLLLLCDRFRNTVVNLFNLNVSIHILCTVHHCSPLFILCYWCYSFAATMVGFSCILKKSNKKKVQLNFWLITCHKKWMGRF